MIRAVRQEAHDRPSQRLDTHRQRAFIDHEARMVMRERGEIARPDEEEAHVNWRANAAA